MSNYTAEDIEVLTGLEPVRKRPGMYTDTSRPNHLAQEVIDNSVDEALAGHASRIDVVLHADGSVTVADDGRGMPVDTHPVVRTKLAALEQAKLDLSRTTVHAPTDGIVVTVPLVAGEQITAAEPLFAIVTDTPPWVDANFKETELTYVRVGQKATVALDIYPGIVWEAEVESISPATGAEFAILPPQNASGNWVKVVQRLPVRLKLHPHADAPPLRAGMTATATVDTTHQRSLTDLFGDPAIPAH